MPASRRPAGKEPPQEIMPGHLCRHSLGASPIPWPRRVFILLFLAAAPAWSQEPIKDNSFLIEEAYNQEWGVVQHISAFSRVEGGGEWVYTFTQEWPVPNERHQLGFTLPVLGLGSGPKSNTGLGDVAAARDRAPP